MKYSLFIILLAMGFNLMAQTPAYQHYSLEEGLPSTMVYSMTQDTKGFMWFGTNNGLARFDGSEFKIYGIMDGLPDPEVLNLFEDSQGRLWISCYQKEPCYLKENIFFTYENDSLLAQLNLKDSKQYFYEDQKNQVWITSHKGKKCRYGKSQVQCFDSDGKKIRYFGEWNGVLLNYNASTLQDFSDPQNPKTLWHKYLLSFPFMPSVYLHQAQLYILKGNELTVVDILDESKKDLTIRLNVPYIGNKVSLIENGNMWINDVHSMEGFFKIKMSQPIAEEQPESFLKGRQASSVFKDKEKNIWLSTLNDGLYFAAKENTVIYNKNNQPALNSDNITAITLTSNHRLILGTVSGGIYLLNGGGLEPIDLQVSSDISRVRQILSVDDSTWIVIMDKAIYAERNGQPNLQLRLGDNGHSNHFLGSPKYLFQDKEEIWISHIMGFHYLKNFEADLVPIIFEINGRRITAIGKDHENNLWIGGMDGLLSDKDNFQIKWGEKFKPAGGRILDIKQADAGKLWVVSADQGLLQISVSDGRITAVSVMNELLATPIHNIKSLFVTPDNVLWMPTNTGVFSLDRQWQTKHFDSSDGLPSNDVNAVVVHHDTLWAATTKGLAKIQLNKEKGDGNFATYISSIRYELDNEANEIDLVYSKNDLITIPSGASMIDLKFSGLLFGSAGQVTFEYIEEEKLLPFKWLTWGNLSTYVSTRVSQKNDTTYIDNGHRYFGVHAPKRSFKTTVTAIARDGTPSLYPDTKTLVILPFWYETIWFSLLVIGLSGYIIWLFARQYTRAKRFRRTASELQLAAIKAQVNPHFVGNSINAIQQFFYPPDPVTASQYISTFTSLLRQTMHLSEVPFISFEKELSFISDYLEMVKLRFGERFDYQIIKKNNIPEDTLFPAMILQPILENATIHGFAPEGISTLQVSFELKENKLFSTVSDNGIGIEASKKWKKTQNRKRISKGIQLLQDKINVMNKMFSLDLKIEYLDLSSLSKNQNGTQVTISFSTDKIVT